MHLIHIITVWSIQHISYLIVIIGYILSVLPRRSILNNILLLIVTIISYAVGHIADYYWTLPELGFIFLLLVLLLIEYVVYKNKYSFNIINNWIVGIFYSSFFIQSLYLLFSVAQIPHSFFIFNFTYISIVNISLYRRKVLKLFDMKTLKITTWMLLILLIINNLFSQTTLWNDIYTSKDYWFSVCITLEGILVSIFIYWIIPNLQEDYEEKIANHEIISLQKYHEKLEHIQNNILKFKHDHHNVLLGLTSIVDIVPLGPERDYLLGLIQYSEEELSKINIKYVDLNNIQNIGVKNFLLGHFFEMEQYNIPIHFECMKPLLELPMNQYDFLRLLGNCLDNARESFDKESKELVDILFINVAQYLEVVIRNPHNSLKSDFLTLKEPGISTKEKHAGLGLAIIEDFQQKYNELLVNYSISDHHFEVSIVIYKEV